jgi:anti-anti-sigma factor
VGIGYARGWGQLTVQVVAIDDYGLLLSGEVDMGACEEFREFAELAVDGRREVVLDVVDLAFLDSAGVRAILRLAGLSCPNGLVLHLPRENVQRVLDMQKIEEVPGIRVKRRGA